MSHFRIYRYIFLLLLLSPFYEAQFSDEQVLAKLDKIQPLLSQKPDSAIFVAQQIIFNSKNEKLQTHAYINISISKGFLGEKDSAIHYGMEAKKIAIQLSNPELVSQTYGNLSLQYRNAKLFGLAKEETKNGLDYLEKTANSEDKIWIKAGLLRELAKINELEQNSDSTILYINKAFQTLRKEKNQKKTLIQLTYASLYNDLSKYYLKQKQFDKAENNAQKAIKTGKNLPYETIIKKYAYLNLSYIYLHKNEIQRCIDTLKIVEKQINVNEYPLRMEVYNVLAESYRKLGDVKNYQKYEVQAENLEDKLGADELIAINGILKIVEDENRKIRKRNLRIKTIIIAISILAIALIIALGMMFRRNMNNKKTFESYVHKIETEKISTQTNRDLTSEKTSITLPNTEKSAKKISTDIEKAILSKLKTFEEEKHFNEINTTLYKLSNDFDVNSKYLSEIILKHKGQNFNNYINGLRINNICQEIIDHPEYRKYKISYLAEISGFSSGEIFARIFKKITGISPSVFIKNSTKLDTSKND